VNIALNNDTVICEGCYEPQEVEVDPGLVPFGYSSLPCACCGNIPSDLPQTGEDPP
jgi:hypothetical protein